MSVYYNELDPQKAQWIRELIKAKVVAQGEVDERSIVDVQPDDLRGFTQCHFFAGIGVWSYALRLAGWPDDRECWTLSCPCPSFSAAGKGRGFDDPRHLWPHGIRLIRERRPATVFGEQVAAAIGHGWLDLVQTDLEAEGYAVGKAVLGACSVGAPHIRQRLYFVGAQPDSVRHGATRAHASQPSGDGTHDRLSVGDGDIGRSAPVESRRSQQLADTGRQGASLLVEAAASGERVQSTSGRGAGTCINCGHSEQWHPGGICRRWLCGCGIFISPHADGRQSSDGNIQRSGEQRLLAEDCGPGWLDPLTARSVVEAGATRGFWSDCDWWYGRDGRYRPIEPGIQPLAHGVAGRVLKLRGYGDAICAEVARDFIEAFQESVYRESNSFKS